MLCPMFYRVPTHPGSGIPTLPLSGSRNDVSLNFPELLSCGRRRHLHVIISAIDSQIELYLHYRWCSILLLPTWFKLWFLLPRPDINCTSNFYTRTLRFSKAHQWWRGRTNHWEVFLILPSSGRCSIHIGGIGDIGGGYCANILHGFW